MEAHRRVAKAVVESVHSQAAPPQYITTFSAMAYLVRIGPHPSNIGGVQSRGHHVYRRGTTVYSVWGSVEVRPGRKFYWCYRTQHKVFRHRSEKAALEKLRDILHEHVDLGGYSRLPAGVKIQRTAATRGSTPRS